MTEPVDPGPGQYAAQPWPAPPPYPGPYAYPPQYPPQYPPPPATGHRLMWILLGLVAVLVAGAIVAVVVIARSGSDRLRGPRHELSAPSTFDRYTRLTGADAQDTAAQMRDRMRSVSSEAARTFGHALIALYGSGSQATPSLVLIAANANHDKAARALFAHGRPAANAREFLRGAQVTGVTDYDAGPLGGALLCGRTGAAAKQLPVCVWMDYSTLGFVVAYEDVPPAVLARTTLTLRNAAEH